MSTRILIGDCLERLRTLPPKSVHCCVCSPPYWGLRDYKIPPSIWGGDPTCAHYFADENVTRQIRKGMGLEELGKRYRGGGKKHGRLAAVFEFRRGFCQTCNAWRGCLGLEPTYQLYVEHMAEVFREVWRVLRDDGTLWLNLGDCYATGAGSVGEHPGGGEQGARWAGAARQHGGKAVTNNGREVDWGYRSRALDGGGHLELPGGTKGTCAPRPAMGKHVSRKGSNRAQRGDGNGGVAYGPMTQPNRMPQPGLKPKDKAGIPWRVAFALQDQGWFLRQEIVWHKLNPMPESIYDRPTSSHEQIFLFSKSGNTLCWRHRGGRWVWAKPTPDYVWRHRKTRVERRTEPRTDKKQWVRINLWRGFDYYYDFAAIMEPSSPDSHARAARGRSGDHKYADGGPGNQSIAKGSPSAGRLPVPAGWDQGEGRHGSVHRDGRRQEVGIGHNARPRKAVPNDLFPKATGPNSRVNVDRVPRSRKLAPHDTDGPRIKSNDSFDAALASADLVAMRNKRSVWSIATEPFRDAHFATFPPALIAPCILAGCPKGGTVLDPFGGAGTTALVADRHQRDAVLIELNESYAAMAADRIRADGGMLAQVEVCGVPLLAAE